MKKHIIKNRKIKIKKIDKAILTILSNKITQLEAQVDPEYLKKLSRLVKKELVSKKDTEDYNLNLVSEAVDKVLKLFMEGGQSEFEKGDYIKVFENIDAKIQGFENYNEFEQSVEKDDYSLFPFSQAIESELRAMFLLQTSRKDTFKKLFEEFKELITKYTSQEDANLLFKAVITAETRIFKNQLLFPSPPQGYEQGLLRKLTDQEKKELNVIEDFLVDERIDNHDLLALKELILIMQGKTVHSLSIGPSFFAKYMPEIKQLGYDGVLFKVVDDKLHSIKMAKLPVGNVSYSPVEAAMILFFNEYRGFKEVPADPDGINAKDYDTTTGNVPRGQHIPSNNKFFVINDGCVAIPSSKLPYDFEIAAKNDTRLPAGEVFLFENIDGKVVETRIGFVPYRYNQLHVLHQHGSMIYGTNDQMFQSCYREPLDFAEDVVNDYKKWWHQKVQNGTQDGDAFSPAVVAARLHWFPNDETGKVSDPTDILDDKNRKILALAVHSVTEQTDFTRQWTLDTLHYYHMLYTRDIRKYIAEISEHEAPLNRRWFAKKYNENGVGITVEKQPTLYIKLAKQLTEDKNLQTFQLFLKLKHIDKRVSEGKTFAEAADEVFKDEDKK